MTVSPANPDPTPAPLTFSCRGARSSAITGVVIALIVVETAVLHLLLVRVVPVLAYLLTLSSLALLLWLIRDFRALARVPALTVTGDRLRLTVGKRIAGEVPVAAVRADRPTWKDLSAGAPRYLNGTKPATPNIMLFFEPAQVLTIVGAVRRPVIRLALHLDDPDRCIAALMSLHRPSHA